MHSSIVLSIVLLATSALPAPVVYGTGYDNEISARDVFSEASSYITTRDTTTLEQRAPNLSAQWKKKIGASITWKGHDALVASIIKKQDGTLTLNSETYKYIGEAGSKTEGEEIPEGVEHFATSDEAADELIKNNDKFVTLVMEKYKEIIQENDGAKGGGTQLGNHPHSYIV